MNKVKLLSILVGLLLVLNIVILSFTFLRKGPNRKGPHRGINKSQFIKDQFQFDDVQVKAFESSKSSHQKKSDRLRTELTEASNRYYNTDSNDSLRVRYYEGISDITKKIYEVNTKHFDDVRKICRPDQLVFMDSFIHTLMNKRGKKHQRSKKK